MDKLTCDFIFFQISNITSAVTCGNSAGDIYGKYLVNDIDYNTFIHSELITCIVFILSLLWSRFLFFKLK